MEGRPPPTPPQEPPATPPPGELPPEPLRGDAEPARVGDLRALRRWLVVAGVWAVAASAIAIIALLEATKDEEPKGPRAVTGAQLGRVQRDLDERIDALESQIEELPRSNDVTKLERRLKRVEDGAANARDDVRGLRGDIDDLEQSVEDVEQQQPAAPDDTTNTETTP